MQQQRGHVFQGRRAQIPRKKLCEFWAELFFCCERSYSTDPYSLYNYVQSVKPYGFGTKIEAVLGMIFEVYFRFLFVVSGSYRTIRTINCWHGKRGTEEAVQQYEFGTFFEIEFLGLF
jgi:hypothetical protein